MAEMGIQKWALAWLAFSELNGRFDHTAAQLEALRERGWLDDLPVFASSRTRIIERVASSPYFYAVAFGVGGDPWVGGNPPVGGQMIHPKDAASALAKRRCVDESKLFTEDRIDAAILQFHLDLGLSALRQGSNSVALRHLTLASEQGSAAAQFALGRMYAEGVKARQDHLLAHKWLNLAVARLAKVDRDDALKLRQAVSRVLTPDRLAEAEMLARQWLPKTWSELATLDPQADQFQWF